MDVRVQIAVESQPPVAVAQLWLVRRVRSGISEMKPQNNLRSDDSNPPCRKHPVLCTGLLTFMFAPAIAAEITLGRYLAHAMPNPGLLAIMCVAPTLIVLFAFGMFIGAPIWLLLMKPFAHRGVLASFFLAGPKVPVFSALCSKVFNCLYGEDRLQPNDE